ncbi:hypothetical protein J8J27_33620, partial [Mycobacterium tuberculosis]|nr:hypothetical protein [Mycobacterium tuberculosis]
MRDLAGLKGQSLAAPVGTASTVGMLGLAALAKAGVAERDLGRLDDVVGSEMAVQALIDRRVDAALVWLPDG